MALPGWLEERRKEIRIYAHTTIRGCAESHCIPRLQMFDIPTPDDIRRHLQTHLPYTMAQVHWVEQYPDGSSRVYPNNRFLWNGYDLVVY